MKSRYLSFSVLSVLLFCASFATLAAPPPSSPGMENRVSQLEAQVADLQAQLNATTYLLAGVSKLIDPNTGQPTLRIAGLNVQIVNGFGSTTSGNGVGNLIIGYNETRGDAECPDGFECNRRDGSHNLIMGIKGNYTAHSGIVAGSSNEISAAYASVTGGDRSIASGPWSSVSSGVFNIASGEWSSVNGGVGNKASGPISVVSGGDNNTASGTLSSVSGGEFNTASDAASSVSGGDNNAASGLLSSVSGGSHNTASGGSSSVSGGIYMTSSTDYCTVGDDGVDC